MHALIAKAAAEGASTPAEALSPEQILTIILLAGLMGLFGQGVRAVVGLKSMTDYSREAGQDSIFSAARLLVSLTIGFLAGIATALAMGLAELRANLDVKSLLGLAAGGYAGTDVIEAFISKYLPSQTPQTGPAKEEEQRQSAGDASRPATAPETASIDGVPDQVATMQAQLADVVSEAGDNSLPTLSAKLDEVHALISAASLPAGVVHAGDVTGAVTAIIVKKMFPATPLPNISKNLPFVLAGLRWADLADRDMVNMALSTIRAETEGFVPISEGRSKFNTLRTPFDLYDAGTKKGTELGNNKPGDGPLFKGRGYVQLTGRSNYETIGPEVDADLAANPELANSPAVAGKILAQFLKNHEDRIRTALAKGDLKTARKLVNGGSHGFPQFSDAFRRGEQFLPVG